MSSDCSCGVERVIFFTKLLSLIMTLPFGLWDSYDAFNRALEFEEEQDEQLVEEQGKIEDEFIVRLSSKISSTKEKEQIAISKLIICTDQISAGFMDAYYLSQGATKVGLVAGLSDCDKEENSVYQNAFTDKTCFIYSFADKQDVLVCQSKRKIKNEHMFDWVEKVFSKIRPGCVVILTSVQNSSLQLQINDNDGEDALRQLRTESFEMKTNIATLEEPNLVKDLSAAVMMHCQIHGIPAILYLLATQSFIFDVNSVKAFVPLLKEDVFHDIKKNSEHKTSEFLKMLCNIKPDDKGVYI